MPDKITHSPANAKSLGHIPQRVISPQSPNQGKDHLVPLFLLTLVILSAITACGRKPSSVSPPANQIHHSYPPADPKWTNGSLPEDNQKEKETQKTEEKQDVTKN